jgi:uncharacterized protein (TIGR02246 family)
MKNHDILTAPRPHDLHQALARAWNAGDVDVVAALFDPDGRLVPGPGDPAVGPNALASTLAGFLEVPGAMTIETTFVVEAGDLALTRSHWFLGDRSAPALEASGVEIMHRGPDGNWRFLVDHPFGANPPG